MRVLPLLIIVALAAAGCARVEAIGPPVEVQMRNVTLHVTPDIALRVRHLRGRFIASSNGQTPYLDDPRSYSVAVDSGEVAVDLASLNAMMARSLGQGNSNVEKLQVTIDEKGQLRQKGTLDKGINIPFNVKASVSLSPDGRIRVHSESVKGFGVPLKPLMKLFSIEMDDMLKVRQGRGVTVVGNDLLLDPAALLPPPAMRGRITAVRIEGNALVQTFGGAARSLLSPPATSQNYIYWRGGHLAFGKLTMTETDLELVDVDPKDPFDFSVDRWNDQLVAGYSKTTARRGLKAYLPDYNDLPRGRR